MRGWIRPGQQHVFRFYIHVDNTIPSTLDGRWLVSPITAIAKGICHGVEDVPKKSFWKDEAVSIWVNDDHHVRDIGWDLYR